MGDEADALQGPWPLVGSDEPPPFSIFNPDGSAKVLLVGDHVSNRIPRALDSLGLTPAVLAQHVAYDVGALALITRLAQHLDAPAVLAGYSRLVVDLNRGLEHSGCMPAESDGIPIPGNQGLSREARAQRVQSFYTPYRKAIDTELARLRERCEAPALIAIHTFTPTMGDFQRPWHVGVLWDQDPRIPVPLMQRLRTRPEQIVVGDNEPYSGKHPADHTVDHHAEAAGLPHVSIETRQDLVETEAGATRWADLLAAVLGDILADPDLYRLWEG